MTKEQRQAARARCEAATPARVATQYNSADARQEYFVRFRNGYESGMLRAEDAEFFAAARQDLLSALDALDTKDAEIALLSHSIARMVQAGFQVAELRKDKARLDFWEEHPRAVVFASGYLGAKDGWVYRGPDHMSIDAEDLRGALDGAMTSGWDGPSDSAATSNPTCAAQPQKPEQK